MTQPQRKRATAEEIHADLRARLEQTIAQDAKFVGCEAPRPRPTRTLQGDGSNWTVDGFPVLADGCFSGLVRIVDEARREYELVA